MKTLGLALKFLTSFRFGELWQLLNNPTRWEIKKDKHEIKRRLDEQRVENRAERLEDVGDRRDERREGKKQYGALWRIKKKRDEADK